MRVLMLSWEYPPRSVGGLARHVYDLAGALARDGVEILLVTCAAPGAPEYEEEQRGVHVYRVSPFGLSAPDFTTWVLHFNVAMLERIMALLKRTDSPQLVHAHDWLVAYAARAVKHALAVPLVATIHATEFGRHNGLHNPTQNYISNVEWWLTYEAWRVIVCSRYMEGELKYIFQLPGDKIRVIHNGVDPSHFTNRSTRVRRDFYAAPDEQIVFYVGRLVREKGVQVLLEAVPHILAHQPKTKFVIGGKGPYEGELRALAERLGIANRVYFTGYIDDEVRNALYHWASVAVFPSLYEPFGIVALEAMAARTPVVVADAGGLGEIVEHGLDGLKAYVGDANSLAQNILWVLGNPDQARLMQERAYRKVRTEYNWQEIAGRTRRVYDEVLDDWKRVRWTPPGLGPGRLLDRMYQVLGRGR